MKRFYLLLVILMVQVSSLFSQSLADTLDVLHYNIHIYNLNMSDHTLAGQTDVTWVNKLGGHHRVPLNLQALEVDSVRIGQDLYFFDQNGKTMHILFTDPLVANDTLTARIYYHGEPFHEDWGGYHFSGDYSFNLGVGFESIPHNLGKTWFPCVDDFTDRATFDVYATLDTGVTATGGGTLVDTVNQGNGTTTWHWQMIHELPTYLVSLATGPYVLYSDSYQGMNENIPIEIFTRPGDTGKVAGSFVNLHAIMDFFEAHFGPYPFEKIGYTSTAIGAMEHAGNISYPHFAINGNTSNESLYTHELSHMWFGNKVTCSTAEDMWLNEGWATFCELYYLEGLYSHTAFLDAMRTMHKDVLLKAHEIDGGYWALNNIPQNVTYGKTAYDKGGTVVNALRAYLGDSLFFESVKAYLNNFAYQSVSSEQMRDFFTSYTGIDMSGFFDAWVFTPGTPHFSIDSSRVTPEGNQFKVDIYLQQKFKGADFLAQDVVVEVGFMDGHFQFQTDTVHFSGAAGHSVKLLDFNPVAVMMDPFETACDATTDSYKIFTEPQEYTYPDSYFKLYLDACTDSSLLRVTHHWAAPDTLKTPVEGLRISNYRYWQTEGLLDNSFQARGRFYFSQGGYLDGDLIQSSADSVVILYRAHSSDEWQMVDQELVGTWMIGYIFVNDLQLGEYTLAVWDKTIVSADAIPDLEKQIQIYPNPSKGEVTFVFPVRGNYRVVLTNENGFSVGEFEVSGKEARWSPEFPQKGLILVSVFKGKELLETKKVILQ